MYFDLFGILLFFVAVICFVIFLVFLCKRVVNTPEAIWKWIISVIVPFFLFLVAVYFSIEFMNKSGKVVKKKPQPTIIIQAKTPPQVDTTISIKDGVRDTSYVYKFKK